MAARGRDANEADDDGDLVRSHLSLLLSDSRNRLAVAGGSDSEPTVGHQDIFSLTFDESFEQSATIEIQKMLLSDLLHDSVNFMKNFFQFNLASPTGWRGLPEITTFLQLGPPNLKFLFLDEMVGTNDDFRLFAEALRMAPLETLLISYAYLLEGNENRNAASAALDPLVTSLLAMPTVKEIALGPCLKSISHPKIASLFASTTLKTVTLFGREALHDENMVPVAVALETSSIQDFRFQLFSEMTALSTGKAMSKMLKTNKHLKSFKMIVKYQQADEVVLELLNGLGVSRVESVKLVHTVFPMSSSCEQGVLRMAERNVYLKEVQISQSEDLSDELKSAIHFYVALNRTSRLELFTGPGSTSDWIEALAKSSVAGRVDQLYYYLSYNPSLCNASMVNDALPFANFNQTNTKKRKRLSRAAKSKVSSYRYH